MSLWVHAHIYMHVCVAYAHAHASVVYMWDSMCSAHVYVCVAHVWTSVCMYTRACTCVVHIWVCVSMCSSACMARDVSFWRDVTLHLFVPFETGSLAEPEGHWLGWLAKELQRAICLISQVLVSQACAAMPGSTPLPCGSCILALIHVKQAFYQLSHLPRPPSLWLPFLVYKLPSTYF